MKRDWEETRRRFRLVAFRKRGSIKRLAAELPASKSTVYRILNGETQPVLAIRVAVERIVEEEEKKP